MPRLLSLYTLALLAISPTHIMAKQVFEATNEWQVVPEGYEIPGGLHVKMNFETGEKQAKLADKESNSEQEQGLVTQDQIVLQEQDQLLQQASEDISLGHTSKLEEVAEWAHDAEFGETIASSPTFLPKLISLMSDQSQSGTMRELAARVFGATFNNNPAALNYLFPGHDSVVGQLLTMIAHENAHPVVQSRLVYALGSLLTDGRALAKYDQSKGDQVLQGVFESCTMQVQIKIAVLVEKLVFKDKTKATQEWSDLLQQVLSAAAKPSDDLKPILEALVTIHETASPPPPVQKSFLKWIASLASSWTSSSEISVLAKEVRHRVFGNPNASRKDEL